MGGSVNMGGGGKRKGRRRRAALMTEINVTPFVDVMLVLLIIFMVTAPLLTAGVQVDLPAAQGAQIDAPKNEPLIITVKKDGTLYIGKDETPFPLADLTTKLKAIAGTRGRGGTDEPVFVFGDKDTVYGNVARVMARIKEAGFRKLSLVTNAEQGG